MTTRIGQLQELFVLVFSEAELRRFVYSLPDGEEIAADLPGQRVSRSEIAFELAALLDRRKLVNAPFFKALMEAAPGRADEIVSLAAAYDVSLLLLPASKPRKAMAPMDLNSVPVTQARSLAAADWMPVAGKLAAGLSVLVGGLWWSGAGLSGQRTVDAELPAQVAQVAQAEAAVVSPEPEATVSTVAPVSPVSTAPTVAASPMRPGLYQGELRVGGYAGQLRMTVESAGDGSYAFDTESSFGFRLQGTIYRTGGTWYVHVLSSNDTTSLVGPVANRITRRGDQLLFENAQNSFVWTQVQ